MSTNTQRRFAGLNRLYGEQSTDTLARAHVCVVGVGGVGSWAVEALARCGVGTLTLIDADHVVESNVNRQVQALTETLGKAKTTALAFKVGPGPHKSRALIGQRRQFHLQHALTRPGA